MMIYILPFLVPICFFLVLLSLFIVYAIFVGEKNHSKIIDFFIRISFWGMIISFLLTLSSIYLAGESDYQTYRNRAGGGYIENNGSCDGNNSKECIKARCARKNGSLEDPWFGQSQCIL